MDYIRIRTDLQAQGPALSNMISNIIYIYIVSKRKKVPHLHTLHWDIRSLGTTWIQLPLISLLTSLQTHDSPMLTINRCSNLHIDDVHLCKVITTGSKNVQFPSHIRGMYPLHIHQIKSLVKKMSKSLFIHSCEWMVIGHPLSYIARRLKRLRPLKWLEWKEMDRLKWLQIAVDLMEHNFWMLNAHFDNP